MAVGVIDLLEGVEVEQQQGALSLLASGQRERLLELCLQGVAVGQLRETVVMRQVRKLRLDRLAIADVATDAAIAAEAAGLIEDRHAARAQPGIALRTTAQIFDVAERSMGLEHLPMGLD